MKKLIALFLVAVMALSCLVGCGGTENEDDKMSIMSLIYTSVDYFGGYTEEYYFDFEKNILTKHSFFPGDEESDNTETLAEFTDEEKVALLDRLNTAGLFDIDEDYPAPPDVCDGGGWSLKVNYSDGTSTESTGSNNKPTSVFSECAYAFFDLCGDGIVASVPLAYYTPPNISYEVSYTVGNPIVIVGGLVDKRGNYKWNGFEESEINYFDLNQNDSFYFSTERDLTYQLALSTANYRNYERFVKCEVVSYDFNEELSEETLIIDSGWFRRIDFALEANTIYIVRLGFENGDFVEYSFNTNQNNDFVLPRPETNLEFWIGENVDNVDFSKYEFKSGMMGGDQYYGTGYVPTIDEHRQQIDPDHCVIYSVTSFPDYSDETHHVTHIRITDPSVEFYGISLNSSFEEFEAVMKAQGFTVTSPNGNFLLARKGKYIIGFDNIDITIRVEVENREGIVF